MSNVGDKSFIPLGDNFLTRNMLVKKKRLSREDSVQDLRDRLEIILSSYKTETLFLFSLGEGELRNLPPLE